MWPQNSPDINPVDYATWGALQQKVYLQCQFENVDQLKLALETEWSRLSQTFTRASMNGDILENVVKNNGGHIEHLFK